jgi:hypothetical protein
MDPLSDVLSLLKPRSYVSGGFDGFRPVLALRGGSARPGTPNDW